ncbi:sugar phosphate isomerase/epimerase family protein [Arenibacter sp. GZD96]|uniref:sugar phosphate isomerase/epimerase family protein n=1 Tax=Aurantibrevibacter litoralis TaxID=3106030 RepID=UPI002AFDFAD3|nr:sugar phosphate isomerase/epimerase family protein [Arenibacter sp. GZD-96]MEA1784894.1 sugar phosphate isomerase/epimerase family protein [Arenibacter sp. GZD-96]
MKKIVTFILLMGITAGIRAQKPEIGIAEYVKNDSLVAAIGFSCMLESVSRLVSPITVTDAQFEANKAMLRQMKTPMYAFNIFIPATLKVVGPTVDENAVLSYVEKLMQRLTETNTKVIVWGSGGSRNLPEGWDKRVAFQQIIAIGKKIALLGEKYGITVALESLNTTECNFINSVKEALYVVKKVDHPNLRLTVDIYHMLKDNEHPKIIYKTKKYLFHVEIAEREGRTPPGVAGTDFKPYLRPMAAMGYQNKIIIEAYYDDLAEIGKMTKDYLQRQIDAVYTVSK